MLLLPQLEASLMACTCLLAYKLHYFITSTHVSICAVPMTLNYLWMASAHTLPLLHAAAVLSANPDNMKNLVFLGLLLLTAVQARPHHRKLAQEPLAEVPLAQEPLDPTTPIPGPPHLDPSAAGLSAGGFYR